METFKKILHIISVIVFLVSLAGTCYFSFSDYGHALLEEGGPPLVSAEADGEPQAAG